MNCTVEFVYDSFRTYPQSDVHRFIPYMIFAFSSFILLFGAWRPSLSISLANSVVLTMIGVDIVSSSLSSFVESECISLTVSMFILLGISFILSSFVIRYFRHAFFSGLTLAISSYNIVRPIPLPVVVDWLPVVLEVPLLVGWGVIGVSLLIGILFRKNIYRTTRLICAAHGSNGICTTLPIIMQQLSVTIQKWQMSVLYFIIFALSYFIQYIPKKRSQSEIDYGLFV